LSKAKDLSGMKFGKLTVLRRSSDTGGGKKPTVKWICRCDCGKVCTVPGGSLKTGHTKSCGCLHTKHHGGRDEPRLYNAWLNMRRRVNDPTNKRYASYGGKGVKICDEWQNDFIAFRNWAKANGYADNLTIDRIDNNGDYCPENCRWVDSYVQQNNTSRNRYIYVRGELMTMANAAKTLGLTYSTVQHRVERGQSVDRPPERKRKTCHTIYVPIN